MADKGFIVKNGIIFSGGGGSGNAKEEELTLDQYTALSEEKKMDGTTYYIKNATNSSLMPVINVTNAEYLALGDKVNTDNIIYNITDVDEPLDASAVKYGDSNVKSVIDSLNDISIKYFDTTLTGASTNSTINPATNWFFAYTDMNMDSSRILSVVPIGWKSGERNAVLNWLTNGEEQILIATTNSSSITVRVFYF